MNEPRQKQFLAAGKEGCLFFVLCQRAEGVTGAYIDSYLKYLYFTRTTLPGKLFIMEDNCYVNDIAVLFSTLTGQAWTCTKEDVSYTLKAGELEITRLEKAVSPTVTATHFVGTDGTGFVDYDPLGADLTGWKPAKKYILRRTS